jgi:hypothetical protein
MLANKTVDGLSILESRQQSRKTVRLVIQGKHYPMTIARAKQHVSASALAWEIRS